MPSIGWPSQKEQPENNYRTKIRPSIRFFGRQRSKPVYLDLSMLVGDGVVNKDGHKLTFNRTCSGEFSYVGPCGGLIILFDDHLNDHAMLYICIARRATPATPLANGLWHLQGFFIPTMIYGVHQGYVQMSLESIDRNSIVFSDKYVFH
jgi:hypothetical protein